MNDAELKEVQRLIDPDPVIRYSKLAVLGERTLLVGTTSRGIGCHVYLKDRKIHRLMYQGGRAVEYTAADSWSVHRLTEGLMVRSEYTHCSFACAIVRRGGRIHFLPYIDALYQASRKRAFCAPIREELT